MTRSLDNHGGAQASWDKLESWTEAQIRIAQAEGAFDNLPGAGKPLPNLGEEHDPLWWVKRFVKREQIALLPPSLELLRKVEAVLAAIETLPDEATVRGRVAALNVEIARVNATVVEGPPTRLGALDVDKVVAAVATHPLGKCGVGLRSRGVREAARHGVRIGDGLLQVACRFHTAPAT